MRERHIKKQLDEEVHEFGKADKHVVRKKKEEKKE